MSGWRQFAQALKERTGPSVVSAFSADRWGIGPYGTNGTNGTGPVSVEPAAIAASDPSTWAIALARIEPAHAPAGYDPEHWRNLVNDARWLCERHGHAAYRLGWKASDLFGLGAAQGWGGLADHLEGSRKLMLTDRIAHWRGDDLEGWLWRETMRPMPLVWELKP